MPKTQNKEADIIVPTGQACPFSGEWHVVGLVTTSIILSKGDIMPTYLGKDVLWQLIHKG